MYACVCVDRIRGRTRDLAYRSGLTGSKEKKETERESLRDEKIFRKDF